MKHDSQSGLNIPEGATILRGPDVWWTIPLSSAKRSDRHRSIAICSTLSGGIIPRIPICLIRANSETPSMNSDAVKNHPLHCPESCSSTMLGCRRPCDACPMRLTGTIAFKSKEIPEVSSPLSFTRQKQSMSGAQVECSENHPACVASTDWNKCGLTTEGPARTQRRKQQQDGLIFSKQHTPLRHARCKRTAESLPVCATSSTEIPRLTSRIAGTLRYNLASHVDAVPTPVADAASPSKKTHPCLPSLSRGSNPQDRSLTMDLSFVKKLLRTR